MRIFGYAFHERPGLLARLRSHWVLKVTLSLVVSIVHWTVYFGLQRNPVFPVKAMVLCGVDTAIPFGPHWALVYVSLNLLLPIPPWLMNSKRMLADFSAGLATIVLCGYLVFFFFPTSCPRPSIELAGDPIYCYLARVDYPLNAFPSLHAALAVYAALCCQRVSKAWEGKVLPTVAWIWAVLILYATLATKQHVLMDVLAGGVLGIAGFTIFAMLQGRGGGR